MATDSKCTRCGFDFEALRCEVEVKLILNQPQGVEGDKIRLYCLACGKDNRVDLRPYGVFSWNGRLFRWSAAAAGRFWIDISPSMKLMLPEDRLEVINVQSICYDSVPVFRLANGKLSAPRWPVRKEYLDFIDIEKTEKASQPEVTKNDRYVIQLYFKGLARAETLDLPCIAVNPERPPISDNAAFEGVHLVLWPNVPYRTWKRYFLRFGCTEERVGQLYYHSREIKVFAYADGELGAAQPEWIPIDALGSDGYTRFGCCESRPAHVAIEFGQKSGGIWQIPAAEYRNYPDGFETKIAVDFGTSNTCVATGDDQQQQFISITSSDLFIIDGSELPTRINFADTWPPRRGFGKNKALLPTELLTRENIEELRMQAEKLKKWRPVVDYGIPSSSNKVDFKEDDHIIAEFKWYQRIQDGVLRGYAEELQKRYIEYVLLFALARLAHDRKLSARVGARFSFPLAFDKNQREKYEQVLSQATQAVSLMTGLEISLDLPLVDEARAAASSIVPFGKACLYVDIGGGSSDIALDIIRLENNVERPQYKYIASFQYAGGALVDAFDGGRCLIVPINRFRRMLREVGQVKELLEAGHAFENKRERINGKTHYFYSYLQEFLARLLAAHVVSGEWAEKLDEAGQAQVKEGGYTVELYPLGNGWGFGHLFDPEYAKSVFAGDLTRRANEIMEEAEQKAALQGLPRVRVHVPEGFGNEDPKSAVVYGLLRGDGERANRKKEDWVFRTIVGCTTRVGPTRFVQWHRPITDLFARAPEGENEGLPIAALTCPPNEWPAFHPGLAAPHDLDPGLNKTGNDLAKCLMVGAKWFVQSPFHVLLEKLIRPKLKEIL
jgi:hypothetical protein